jgi:hypothetical protein
MKQSWLAMDSNRALCGGLRGSCVYADPVKLKIITLAPHLGSHAVRSFAQTPVSSKNNRCAYDPIKA